MIPVAPVFAGIEDILGALVFILVVVVSVVGQLIAKWREAQQQAQKRAQQQQRPGRPAAGPQRPPAQQGRPMAGAGQDPLKDEIGEFLRRAAERRAGGPAQAAGRPAPPPPPAPAPAARPSRPAPARPSPRLVQAEVVRPAPPPRVAEKPVVLEHLMSDIDLADERMEQHIHDVFEHRVGTLSRAQSEAMAKAVGTPTAAVGLAAMLRDPLSLRQAIVLNEILQRPEDRWE